VVNVAVAIQSEGATDLPFHVPLLSTSCPSLTKVARAHAEAIGGNGSGRKMRPFKIGDPERLEQFGASEHI